ncbi:4'-phosphopantetheinyl transferase family protein [Snodgrassella alvi]|jgi:enterobactin synthetase component D|uniref:4'-phosphopantetheinyl transferase family protein n=1 Tax=Snodgrassella alvi TaxID=1196083 RepID=UPI000C1E3F8B|nr:4'-phosphopantetheinyl transferase superfamily protein [Snodgrassella alvi]PIT46985.1 hypothetical protein BHC51_06645 [Snodgrassella alvi]
MTLISKPSIALHPHDHPVSRVKTITADIQQPTLFSHHKLSIGYSTIHQIRMQPISISALHKLCRTFSIHLPETIQHSKHKRQLEFVAGRLAAQYALQPYGYSSFTLESGAQGQPLFPEPLQGSLSHSSNKHQCLAIACAHKKQPAHRYLGIDIEHQQHQHIIHNNKTILALFLQPQELQHLTTHNISLPQQALLLFSAKESIIKAYFHKHQTLINFTAITYQPSSSQYLHFHIHTSEQHKIPQTAKVFFNSTKKQIITIAYI